MDTAAAFTLADGEELVCPDHPHAGVYRHGSWDNGTWFSREIRCFAEGCGQIIWTVTDEDSWPANEPTVLKQRKHG